MRRWTASFAAALLVAGCATTQPRAPRRSPYELTLPTADGGRFGFGSLRGRPALVTFFATWCFPCLVQAPALGALQTRHRGAGLQVVAVGLDLEGELVLRPYAKAAALPYPVLIANERVRAGDTAYGRITELPASFLFNRKGEVEAAWSGALEPAELEKLVERALR